MSLLGPLAEPKNLQLVNPNPKALIRGYLYCRKIRRHENKHGSTGKECDQRRYTI